jgi:hypothetical protein
MGRGSCWRSSPLATRQWPKRRCIDADGEQGFTFVDRHDLPIRQPDVRARYGCRGVPGNPCARSGGGPHYSADLTVTAMASGS